MHTVSPVELVDAIAEGSLIPCLGPGALCEVRDPQTGAPIPARSEELILALNNGQPMAPKLMWEFSRAAMHVELKRGRRSIQAFLDRTYGETAWSRSALHAELARLRLPYILDLNRDEALPHGDDSHRSAGQFFFLPFFS